MNQAEFVSEALWPLVYADMRYPDESWARRRAAAFSDAAIAAHLEALNTRRWYIAGYRNQLGTVSTMGAENAWLPAVEEVVAELNRDDPENEFFVAYQDVPAWQRLEASQ